ncbi:MAG: hypothetical protein JSS87_09860 [Acidobacteria bacterium]|nr:hypothetical protein [Acidobacteriota bacterium]
MKRPLVFSFAVFCLAAVAQVAAAPVFVMKATTTNVPERIDLPEADAQAILNDAAEYPNEAPEAVACQKEDTYDATLDATYRLLCVRVQLAPGQEGLLVMGTGDYRGETDAPFWLFRKNQLVLKVRADEVNLLSQMSGGMQMIEAVHGKQQVERFAFNGRRYLKVGSSS